MPVLRAASSPNVQAAVCVATMALLGVLLRVVTCIVAMSKNGLFEERQEI